MKNLSKVLTVMSTLVLLLLPFVIWAKAQAIADWWALRDYTPPQAIVDLAERDKLTSDATHIFYVNHPELISDPQQFRQECPQSEQTIVLGCYHSRQNGIDLYDVKDTRLNGVEEVTASHEMLHAAYDRLSTKERDYINGLLNDFYKNELKEQRVLDTIETYKELEPNDVVNEMHSIFATEISDLPEPLENYYKKYFQDRSVIIKYADNYEGEFSSRLAAIKDYDSQLTELKTTIDQEETDLQSQLNQIDNDRRRLQSLRSANKIEEYNALVPSFNTKVTVYNRMVTQLKDNISLYNNLVEKRNAIAQEVRSLDDALDTRLVPQTVQ